MSNHKQTLPPMSVHDILWADKIGEQYHQEEYQRSHGGFRFLVWVVVTLACVCFWTGVVFWIGQLMRVIFQ